MFFRKKKVTREIRVGTKNELKKNSTVSVGFFYLPVCVCVCVQKLKKKTPLPKGYKVYDSIHNIIYLDDVDIPTPLSDGILPRALNLAKRSGLLEKISLPNIHWMYSSGTSRKSTPRCFPNDMASSPPAACPTLANLAGSFLGWCDLGGVCGATAGAAAAAGAAGDGAAAGAEPGNDGALRYFSHRHPQPAKKK